VVPHCGGLRAVSAGEGNRFVPLRLRPRRRHRVCARPHRSEIGEITGLFKIVQSTNAPPGAPAPMGPVMVFSTCGLSPGGGRRLDATGAPDRTAALPPAETVPRKGSAGGFGNGGGSVSRRLHAVFTALRNCREGNTQGSRGNCPRTHRRTAGSQPVRPLSAPPAERHRQAAVPRGPASAKLRPSALMSASHGRGNIPCRRRTGAKEVTSPGAPGPVRVPYRDGADRPGRCVAVGAAGAPAQPRYHSSASVRIASVRAGGSASVTRVWKACQ